jgi:hypothetical protein
VNRVNARAIQALAWPLASKRKQAENGGFYIRLASVAGATRRIALKQHRTG